MVNLPNLELWITPEVGKYGGTLRIIDTSQGHPGSDAYWNCQLAETLIRTVGAAHDPTNLRGGVLKGFDMSPEGKTFTLYFRKGMKWSDGEPLTTEDFEFWYKDVLLNDKLTPGGPAAKWRSQAKPDGEVMKLEIVDDYTLKLSFPESYGGFASVLTDIQSWPTGLPPKHYVKQFHANYTPLEQLEPLIKEAGFEKGEWWRLFQTKKNFYGDYDLDLPVLSPWRLKERSEGRWVFERNPYYYAVDAAGNQLPYIDRLVVEQVANQAAADLKIIAGETDMAWIATALDSVAVYKQYAKEKGYRVQAMRSSGSRADIALHLM
jgi:peptide/nickel transport system substrate-binding protein